MFFHFIINVIFFKHVHINQSSRLQPNKKYYKITQKLQNFIDKYEKRVEDLLDKIYQNILYIKFKILKYILNISIIYYRIDIIIIVFNKRFVGMRLKIFVRELLYSIIDSGTGKFLLLL